MAERSFAGGTVRIARGDITALEVDAIVNAGNMALAGGGGVDGAIHRAGGPGIMAELRRRFPDGCPTGGAVTTGGGMLPAKWIIHAVGPRWRGGGEGEDELLASAWRGGFGEAIALGAGSDSLPSPAARVYCVPPRGG